MFVPIAQQMFDSKSTTGYNSKISWNYPDCINEFHENSEKFTPAACSFHPVSNTSVSLIRYKVLVNIHVYNIKNQ